jgi:hypothetical protein
MFCPGSREAEFKKALEIIEMFHLYFMRFSLALTLNMNADEILWQLAQSIKEDESGFEISMKLKCVDGKSSRRR